MSDDSTSNVDARSNYDLLCDVKIVMGLTCMLLMLEVVQSLNKIIFFCYHNAIQLQLYHVALS
jgi:hypothetical protein